MKLKNPNLPYIFLLVLPFLHIGLGFKHLANDPVQASGAAIVGPIFLIGDWLYGLVLLWLLLSPSLRWRARSSGLMVLGVVTVAIWLASLVMNQGGPGAIKSLSLASVEMFVFYSGPLMAYLVGLQTLKCHPYLRDL